MKMKHNKKRNTAFIFEALIRELTKAIVAKDEKKKKTIVRLVKENFKGNNALAKDLELYKAILDTKGLDMHTAEKLIFEAKMRKKIIDEKELFREQSEIINKINKEINPNVFSNFVPNYRDIATVYQIFDYKTKTKSRVLLEKQMVEKMMLTKKEQKPSMKPIDNLTYKTFVKKFNEKYGSELVTEQKALLSHYIGSFTDNGLELKSYLNEEISRLRQIVDKSLDTDGVKGDAEMVTAISKVKSILDECSTRPIDNEMIQQILKIQNLAKEIES